ncbi:uncharacterized protein BT62DRAFT_933560, partial [Guyanagaster necrorhizus]
MVSGSLAQGFPPVHIFLPFFVSPFLRASSTILYISLIPYLFSRKPLWSLCMPLSLSPIPVEISSTAILQHRISCSSGRTYGFMLSDGVRLSILLGTWHGCTALLEGLRV